MTGLSDVGKKRRRNEDFLALLPERGIAVVADGMGGHPGGDVASRLAAETAREVLDEALVVAVPGGDDFTGRMRSAMELAVQLAHRQIRAHGEEEPELRGMGTTLTAIVMDDGGRWVIGHVGDSRAYRLGPDGFSQLTRDDTWVQQRVESGDILPENAGRSPFAHLLTQCLGLDDEPASQILSGEAQPGDVYLLCSDGLVGMVPDDRIAEALGRLQRDESSPDEALAELIAAANEAGGQDNITAALVHYAAAP